MFQSSVLQPLVDHPSRKPFLTVEADGMRIAALHVRVRQLEAMLDDDDPRIALARSWFAVAYGAEVFQEQLLVTLEQVEPVIRRHFPQARRALAMNLAAQGCHIWFLRSHEEALAPLSEALELMLDHPIAMEADVLKVGEVLADCLRHGERYDEALMVLSSVHHLFLAAIEQDEWTPLQFDEFREQFLELHAHECSAELDQLVTALEGPRVRETASWLFRASSDSRATISASGGNRG